MMPAYASPWMFLGLHFHFIFGFIAISGAVLFVAWVLKQKTEDVKQFAVWALAIGIIGSLLTGNFSSFYWQTPFSWKGYSGDGMMNRGIMGGGTDFPMMQKMMRGMMGGNMGNMMGGQSGNTLGEMMGGDSGNTMDWNTKKTDEKTPEAQPSSDKQL